MSDNGHKIDIYARTPLGTRVYLDGTQVKGLKDVRWGHSAGDAQRVELSLLAQDVTITQANVSDAEIDRMVEADGGAT